MQPRSIAKSVRASWAIAQKPLFTRIGILVGAMATSMSMMSGTAARRVSRPDEEEPADDLDHPDKGRHHRGRGDADLDEPPYAERLREEELLDALGNEDAADQQAHEHNGSGSPRRDDPDDGRSHRAQRRTAIDGVDASKKASRSRDAFTDHGLRDALTTWSDTELTRAQSGEMDSRHAQCPSRHDRCGCDCLRAINWQRAGARRRRPTRRPTRCTTPTSSTQRSKPSSTRRRRRRYWLVASALASTR